MDINLSGGAKGKSDGLDLLGELIGANPNTCSIIVSAEKEPQYYLAGFQTYNIIRFIEKAPWDSDKKAELKLTTKSIILYLDALEHLNKGAWKQALEKWKEACSVFPELKNRFKDIEILVEKATSNPITGLPAGKAVETRLAALLGRPNDKWGILYVTVTHMKEYVEAYGHVVGDEALRAIGQFLSDQLDKHGFIGQIEDILFILLVNDGFSAESLEEKILRNFGSSNLNSLLYNYKDLENGYAIASGKKYTIPILRLTTSKLSDKDGPFTDIHEISARKSTGTLNS
jgi:GGDEF domain-containing protein